MSAGTELESGRGAPKLAPTRSLPPSHRELLDRLYAGEIFLLPPSPGSRRFVDSALELLRAELGPEPRRAHELFEARRVFHGVGALRRAVYLEPRFVELARAVVLELGLPPESFAFDPARLRAVLHRGHEEPRARAAYVAHRDTWYANPAGTVTCWVPLFDLHEAETFVFYPERFRVPVANDSERFDYAAWVSDGWSRKIGWQDEDAGLLAHYPAGLAAGPHDGPDHGEALGFSCVRGARLLFSGAHLHQTRRIETGRSRFSLDLRFVSLDDHLASRAAPSVDDRSRGQAIDDYVWPGRPWPPPR